MEFDNENSRCVSAGPEPDARVCVTLRGEEVEIELKGRSMDLVKMAATALMESIKKSVKPGCWRGGAEPDRRCHVGRPGRLGTRPDTGDTGGTPMKLTDKERNTCAALLCRWAARDNELMASDLYGSSQYYKLLGALTALRTLGLMAETVFSDAPAPGGYYNFGKIMLDGMVYDVPEPKEEMENEDAGDPPAQR